MNNYFEVNGVRVWQFDEIEGEMNTVTEYGCILLFANWMYEHSEQIMDDIARDSLGTIVGDVLGNTSGIRNGNRLDIHDNYQFTETLEFSNLYYHKNGLVYAGIYDKASDKFVGYIEISC